MRIVLAQDVGALHSRTIENRIAVAKSAKARAEPATVTPSETNQLVVVGAWPSKGARTIAIR